MVAESEMLIRPEKHARHKVCVRFSDAAYRVNQQDRELFFLLVLIQHKFHLLFNLTAVVIDFKSVFTVLLLLQVVDMR